MNWIKEISNEEVSSLPFSLDQFWSTPYENLNGSGRNFFSEEESKQDILLFVEEKEKDNREMRGGSVSVFGTVYGINVDKFQEQCPHIDLLTLGFKPIFTDYDTANSQDHDMTHEEAKYHFENP